MRGWAQGRRRPGTCAAAAVGVRECGAHTSDAHTCGRLEGAFNRHSQLDIQHVAKGGEEARHRHRVLQALRQALRCGGAGWGRRGEVRGKQGSARCCPRTSAACLWRGPLAPSLCMPLHAGLARPRHRPRSPGRIFSRPPCGPGLGPPARPPAAPSRAPGCRTPHASAAAPAGAARLSSASFGAAWVGRSPPTSPSRSGSTPGPSASPTWRGGAQARRGPGLGFLCAAPRGSGRSRGSHARMAAEEVEVGAGKAEPPSPQISMLRPTPSRGF